MSGELPNQISSLADGTFSQRLRKLTHEVRIQLALIHLHTNPLKCSEFRANSYVNGNRQDVGEGVDGVDTKLDARPSSQLFRIRCAREANAHRASELVHYIKLNANSVEIGSPG